MAWKFGGITLNRFVIRAIIAVTGVLAALAAIAGMIDRKGEKEREEKARHDGWEMHKPYGVYEKYLKRPLDFFLSSLALVVLSPVMIVTAVLVRVKLGSPILFTQGRPGRNEEIFKLYKFRTMTDERDSDGELLPDEVRMTKFGSLLRSTSLDELPELFNIIRGDMSLIGPRPLLIKYLPRYTSEQRHRHDVLPGLTGYAQAHGRNAVSWNEKFKMDVWYTRNISLKTDVSIFFDTIRSVLKHEGINSETSATMDEFMGTEQKELY